MAPTPTRYRWSSRSSNPSRTRRFLSLRHLLFWCRHFKWLCTFWLRNMASQGRYHCARRWWWVCASWCLQSCCPHCWSKETDFGSLSWVFWVCGCFSTCALSLYIVLVGCCCGLVAWDDSSSSAAPNWSLHCVSWCKCLIRSWCTTFGWLSWGWARKCSKSPFSWVPSGHPAHGALHFWALSRGRVADVEAS